MFDPTEERSLADRRADATRDAIIDAAWTLSRRAGLMTWSLRELAKLVGLAAPTLYAYFDGKHAIYDAMFRHGYEQLDTTAAAWDSIPPTRDQFKHAVRGFFDFCTSDPTRYQLMFQRVIPDFTPSEHAYAASVATYERLRRNLGRFGIHEERHLDLWTAIATGLTDQQISNDPGGDRWRRLIDEAVDLFCDHAGITDEGATP